MQVLIWKRCGKIQKGKDGTKLHGWIITAPILHPFLKNSRRIIHAWNKKYIKSEAQEEITGTFKRLQERKYTSPPV